MKKLFFILMMLSTSAFAQTTITKSQIVAQQAQVATDRLSVAQAQKTYVNDQATLNVMQAELAQQNAVAAESPNSPGN